MKIEIESEADYLRGRKALQKLEAARVMASATWEAVVSPLIVELAAALDDYRQEHYPVGGEPE